jgi:hypothetical protein
MDPEVLQAVLNLPEVPLVESGTITGFKTMMWGIYPALLPPEGQAVDGVIWKVNEAKHFLRLAEYETKAYRWCNCEIRPQNGEIIQEGRVFCWAADPASRDLEEGIFDLMRYQKYFKPSDVRR